MIFHLHLQATFFFARKMATVSEARKMAFDYITSAGSVATSMLSLPVVSYIPIKTLLDASEFCILQGGDIPFHSFHCGSQKRGCRRPEERPDQDHGGSGSGAQAVPPQVRGDLALRRCIVLMLWHHE